MLRYVCISDLHAGAPTSLLMTLPDEGVLRPPKPSAVTTEFVRVLEAFLGKADKPKLILLGDILDLQFSDRKHAFQNAQGFLTAMSKSCCFADNLIATAGNHDHALWTDARFSCDEAAMWDYRDATSAFSETPTAKSRMLDALAKQAGFGDVDFRYPNVGLRNDDRAVLLHHGHFFEDPYRIITTLRDLFSQGARCDLTVSDVAAENAGWIDFFWSTIGDAGLAHNASDLYQNMLTSSGFRRLSGQLSELFSDEVGEQLPLAGDLRVREALSMAARVLLDVTAGKFRDTERYSEV